MPLFYHFLYLVSAFLSFSLAAGFYLKQTKSQVVRVFSAVSVSVSGWIISLYVFYLSTDHATVITSGRLTYVFAALIITFMFVFAYNFPTKSYAVPRYLRTIITFETLSLCVLTFATALIDENEIIVGVSRQTVFGPLFLWFVLHFVALSIATIATLIHKYRHLSGHSRAQLLNLVVGWGAGLVLGLATNVVLPWLGGTYRFEHLGTISALVFVGATTYATAKNELFNMRVLTVETMVVLASTVLLIVSATAPSLDFQAISLVALATMLSLGAYLIHNVRQEILGREKLDTANRDLIFANLQLKETDQIKNEFITMASHQLRTPISVVKGYLSLMLEGAYGTVPDTIKDKLKQMYGLNDRLVQMIDNMLNVARIEKRKIEYNVTVLDILPSVRAVVEPMRLKAAAKRLTLNFNAPNVPTVAYLDEGKFQEVLTNLVDNAIKYTDAGTIEVAVRGDVEGTGYVDVLVKDSGIGMSPDEAGHVFTKFFRAKEAVIREPGTGLGLFIGAKFMSGMGGRLEVVETASGKGTTFVIHLPTHQEEPGMPIV